MTQGWHTAPDGRSFRVLEIKCVHTACWAARCRCGHWLTKHDFDADGAYNGAVEALTRRDRLNRRDFAHPQFQCKAPTPDPKAQSAQTGGTNAAPRSTSTSHRSRR